MKREKRYESLAIFKCLMCFHVHLWTGNQHAHMTWSSCVLEFIFGLNRSMTIFPLEQQLIAHTHTHTRTHFPNHFAIRIEFFSECCACQPHAGIWYSSKMDKNKLSKRCNLWCLFDEHHVMIEMIHFSDAHFQGMSSFYLVLFQFLLTFLFVCLQMKFWHIFSVPVYRVARWFIIIFYKPVTFLFSTAHKLTKKMCAMRWPTIKSTPIQLIAIFNNN